MKIKKIGLLFVFILFIPLYANYSSASFIISFEGNSGGRLYAAASANYLLDGSTGENSGNSVSPDFEVNSGWYYTVSSDDVPPEAVSGIFAVTLAGGNIKISWAAVIDKESFTRAYRVYRSVKQNDEGLLLAQTESLEYTDVAGLIFGINYYYRVKSVDMAGNPSITGNLVITALSGSLSTSVTALLVNSKQGGRLDLSWPAVSGITSYRIYRSTAAGDKGVRVSTVNAPNCSLSETIGSGLFDAVRYFYTAQGVDADGNEQQQGNNQGSAVCDASGPAMPAVFSVTHPDSAVSTDNCPGFFWAEVEDFKAPAGGATGVRGYYYCLSRNSAEIFGANWIFINELSVSFKNILDGDWFFYVLAMDRADNISSVVFRKIVIKTTGSVSGCLTDSEGRTFLKDSRVDLLSSLVAVRKSRTDLAGNYSFAEVPFGNYRLRIYKAGYNPLDSEEFTLSKSQTLVLLNKTVSAVLNIGVEGVAVYPNPCRTSLLTFVYKVEAPAKVFIDIYDASGCHVAGIQEFQALTGFRETRWDASGMLSGVYFYIVKLETGGNIFRFPVKKFSLIR